MVKLFSCKVSIDLYNSGLYFFAEDKPLVEASEIAVIEVEDTVLTQIHCETNGVKIYKVHPNQVMTLETE